MRHLDVDGGDPILQLHVLPSGTGLGGARVDVQQLGHPGSTLVTILVEVFLTPSQKPFVHRPKPEFELGRVQEEDEHVGEAVVGAQTGQDHFPDLSQSFV